MSTPGCQCTMACGDDERVARGLVRPCADFIARRDAAAIERQRQALVQQLGHNGAPPEALATAAETCCCFAGSCRGGEVVNGRLANGLRCREACPC